jgi:ribosomal protein S27AE
MVKWQLKTCPRCGGDVFTASDVDGWYQECLQCSYRRGPTDDVAFRKPLTTEERVSGRKCSELQDVLADSNEILEEVRLGK